MSKTNMQIVCEALWARLETAQRDSKLRILKKRLHRMAEELTDIPQHKKTGWYVMLAKDEDAPSGFRVLGLFNPDKCDEDSEPEWDLCIPVPEPESMREFEGW